MEVLEGEKVREFHRAPNRHLLPSESCRFVYLNVADAELGVAIKARDPGDQDTV